MEEISQYLAALRSLYTLHQNNHWQCSGSNFYAQHQLFQRIYEEVAEDVDTIAEKIIGLFGNELINLSDQINLMQKFCNTWTVEKVKTEEKDKKHLYASLQAEKDFQKLAEILYKKLQENEEMTLGLDDLLMHLANRSESRIYLLQQSLR